VKVHVDGCRAAVFGHRHYRQCVNRGKHEVRVNLSTGYGVPPVAETIRVCGVHLRFLERSYRSLYVALDNQSQDFWNRGIKVGTASLLFTGSK
jgi:hypothetical protein